MPDFYNQLEKELQQCNLTVQGLNNLVKEILVAVNKAVIDKTPVDTGLAVNNWYISAGSPQRKFRKVRLEKDLTQTGYADPSNIPSIRARAEIRAERFKPNTRTQGEFFVTNDTEYISDLEGGKSSQASAGILNPAVAQAEREIQDIINRLNL